MEDTSTRDVMEPADFMRKFQRMQMWICRAIKITSYYSYGNSTYLKLYSCKQTSSEQFK